jgi:hypothetical protein
MTTSYITKKLLEMNEEINDMPKEEANKTIEGYRFEEAELDVHSAEFLRQT